VGERSLHTRIGANVTDCDPVPIRALRARKRPAGAGLILGAFERSLGVVVELERRLFLASGRYGSR